MYTVKTKIDFEAAHRLYDVDTYSKECRENVHGHSYKVTVIVGRKNLNRAGMVIDFKLLKEVLRDRIEKRYDHSCILKKIDPIVDTVVNNCNKVYVVDQNPTAEWMAHFFYEQIASPIKRIDSEVFIKEIQVQETENNIAIYCPED